VPPVLSTAPPVLFSYLGLARGAEEERVERGRGGFSAFSRVSSNTGTE